METNNMGNQDQGNLGSQNPEKKQGYETSERKEAQHASSVSQPQRERDPEKEQDRDRERDLRQAGSREVGSEMGERDSRSQITTPQNLPGTEGETAKTAHKTHNSPEQNEVGPES